MEVLLRIIPLIWSLVLFFRSCLKRIFFGLQILLSLWLFLLISVPSYADSWKAYRPQNLSSSLPTPSMHETEKSSGVWRDFAHHVEELRAHERREAWAYIVSGAIVAIGGGVGYANASDSLERTAFALSQSLGVAGIGYGVYSLMIGSSDRNFYSLLESSQHLKEYQRDDLVEIYLHQKHERMRKTKWIRFVTHSLIAGLNFSHAQRQENPEARSALYFISGINAIAAISLTF